MDKTTIFSIEKTLGQYSLAREYIQSDKKREEEFEKIRNSINKKNIINLFEGIQKSEINLSCLFDNHTLLRLPVTHENCKSKNRCFDLYNIYQQVITSTTQKIQCPSCNFEITKQSLENNFHSCNPFIQIIKEANGLLYRVFLWKINDEIIFTQNFQQQNLERKYLMEKDEQFSSFIIELFKKKDSQFNFESVLKNLPQLKSIKFYAICMFDGIKIKIPVRHRNCKHLETAELTSILKRINENKISICPIQDCNTYFNFQIDKIKEVIGIDLSLLKTITLGFSFSIDHYHIELQSKQLIDNQINNQLDNILNKLLNGQLFDGQDQKTKKKTYKEILTMFEIVFNRDFKDNQRIVQKRVPFTNFSVSLEDKYSKEIISYPAQCIQCPNQNEFVDLRNMIFMIYEQRLTSKNNVFKCPVCGQPFNNPINDSQIVEEIYFDTLIYKEIIDQPQCIETKKIEYNGKKNLLISFYKERIRTKDHYLINAQKNKNMKIIYSNFKCNQTQKPIVIPLARIDCWHFQYVDFDSIYDIYNVKKYLQIQSCNKCPPINQWDDLVFDKQFYEILQLGKDNKATTITVSSDLKFTTFNEKNLQEEIVNLEIFFNGENFITTVQQGQLNQNKLIQLYKSLNQDFQQHNIVISQVKCNGRLYSLQ